MKIINHCAVSPQPPLRLLNWALIAALAMGATSVWSQTLAPERISLRFRDVTKSEVLALPPVEIGDTRASVDSSAVQAVDLNEFIERAIDISPQLQQVRAQLEVAQSGRKIARSDLLPSFSLRHATGPEQSQTLQLAQDKHTYRQSGLRLTQPLYNAPLAQELGASRQAETAAEFRFQSAYDNVLMSVIRSTVDVTTTRLVLDFSNVQLAQLQNILGYLESRVAGGAASPADFERARTRVLNARQTRIEQQAAYRSATLELNRLTGLTPLAIRLPDASRLPGIAIGSPQLQSLALAQNPDLRALQSDIEAQKSRVKAEMSKYLPVVGISLEHDNSKNVQGTNGPHTDTRLLLVASWATSLGGKEWHQAEQARAELRSREAKLTDESQRLSQALEGDAALLQSAVLRIQTAQLEQVSAGKVVEAVEEQLKTGRMGSLLDALDATERFFSARQRLVQSMGQHIKAHAQILQRTGQLRDLKP